MRRSSGKADLRIHGTTCKAHVPNQSRFASDLASSIGMSRSVIVIVLISLLQTVQVGCSKPTTTAGESKSVESTDTSDAPLREEPNAAKKDAGSANPNPQISSDSDASVAKADLPSSSATQSVTPVNTDHGYSFNDVAADMGVSFQYRNGEETKHFAMPENLGGGVGLFDYNNDGRLDLIAAGGGKIANEQLSGLPWGLFLQFENRFSPSAIQARLPDQTPYSHGVAAFDFNNDGFEDLCLTGYGSIELLENMGDGTFVKLNSREFAAYDRWATSIAAADFDGDNNLDLYVASYVDWSFDNHPHCPAPKPHERELCSPKEFSGLEDAIFLSTGDGKFRLANSDCNLLKDGKGLGVIALDVDDDSDTDLYVANDTTDNFLYINDGSGHFEESALLSGAAVDERALPNGSMGLTAVDIDRNLKVDLWVTNYERESFALYRNEGFSSFLHTSRNYGMSALGGMYVGFGTDWEDFDLDGREEIVITNGHVLKYPVNTPRRQQPLLLAWNSGRYEKVEFHSGSYFSRDYEGRGLAVGDIDNDGRTDIAISHINEPIALLSNRCPAKGTGYRITLIGTSSNRSAIGTRVVLETQMTQLLHHVVGGGSYLSHNDRSFTLGLSKEDRPIRLTVFWPSGSQQSFDPLDGNHWTIVEGQNSITDLSKN